VAFVIAAYVLVIGALGSYATWLAASRRRLRKSLSGAGKTEHR
jgi:hypothetical protein